MGRQGVGRRQAGQAGRQAEAEEEEEDDDEEKREGLAPSSRTPQ